MQATWKRNYTRQISAKFANKETLSHAKYKLHRDVLSTSPKN